MLLQLISLFNGKLFCDSTQILLQLTCRFYRILYTRLAPEVSCIKQLGAYQRFERLRKNFAVCTATNELAKYTAAATLEVVEHHFVHEDKVRSDSVDGELVLYLCYFLTSHSVDVKSRKDEQEGNWRQKNKGNVKLSVIYEVFGVNAPF